MELLLSNASFLRTSKMFFWHVPSHNTVADTVITHSIYNCTHNICSRGENTKVVPVDAMEKVSLTVQETYMSNNLVFDGIVCLYNCATSCDAIWKTEISVALCQ